MNAPAAPFKDPGLTGRDVYIRDSDDQALQMKALVYGINYETQEADIGLYPRRWGKFSMIHLPPVYRVTVPLTELSLEPHAGAAQVGYEEILLQRSPDDAVAWMDWTGRTHIPGCKDPDQMPATAVDAGGVPEPTFGAGTQAAITAAATAIQSDPAVIKSVGEALAVLDKPSGAAAPSKRSRSNSASSPPLFTKAEILARLDDVEGVLRKIRSMVEAAL